MGQCTGRNLIQRCEIEIQHHALAADFVDFILDNGYFIHRVWGGRRRLFFNLTVVESDTFAADLFNGLYQ